MKDLAVLTPPFLMAAAVITAIVMFLRHEISRGRSGRADLEDDIQPGARESTDAADNEPQAADTASRPGTES